MLGLGVSQGCRHSSLHMHAPEQRLIGKLTLTRLNKHHQLPTLQELYRPYKLNVAAIGGWMGGWVCAAQASSRCVFRVGGCGPPPQQPSFMHSLPPTHPHAGNVVSQLHVHVTGRLQVGCV